MHPWQLAGLSDRWSRWGWWPHGWLNDTMPGRFRATQARATVELIVSWLYATLAAGPGAPAVSWRFTSTIAPDYDFATNTRQH